MQSQAACYLHQLAVNVMPITRENNFVIKMKIRMRSRDYPHKKHEGSRRLVTISARLTPKCFGFAYVIGTYDGFVSRIAKWSNYVVVSIGYRRAPKHVYPAAFDDCYKTTRYFISNAKKFNVDSTQIAISVYFRCNLLSAISKIYFNKFMSMPYSDCAFRHEITIDSAGGNLAAAVSSKLGKDGDPRFKLTSQTLIYPALQALDLDGGPFFLAKPLMIKFWLWYGEGNLNYFSDFAGNKQLTSEIKHTKYYEYINLSKWLLDPYFAPLMASDEELKDLPPTYVITAEYDPLRDDGFLFASRLRALNKTLELYELLAILECLSHIKQ
ncbi:hypothetical protein KUTeg_012046 [Tegillarca granosa]|uniref:Alpha/beta hydrolase fold-3 domain-containing protein n=1 Tax=Tegillarca granosa TaxID=220873 RepID=A0ABQ9F1V5_TEGGR|nr:hypothetical protein KUTeg_012046 [Tegillarca granosa]